MDPVNQCNFDMFLTSVKKPGSAIHPTLPLIMSMFLQWKLTVVCGKTHWDSDESTSSVDIVIAYLRGTYMVTKVGKYIIMHTNSTIMSNIM